MDRLIKVDEVAKRLNLSKDWVYRHWKQIPGARKESRKVLRFSEQRLDAFIRGDDNGDKPEE